MGIHRVLVRLLAKFVGGEMIAFAVSGSGGGVGVCRKSMKLGGALVSTLWHSVFLAVKGCESVVLNSTGFLRFSPGRLL
jgi:hypothetical protein